MIEQLEADLRDALARRAAEVQHQAGARLGRIDYRPRAHRVRTPVAFGALAGASGAAAVVASVVGLGAGASSAFAGWTPSPTAPASDSQTTDANASCQSRLTTLPAQVQGADLKPVLNDTRGPFTVVILAGASGNASCISGPSFTAVTGVTAAGSAARAGTIAGSSGSGSLGMSASSGPVNAPAAGHVAFSTLATTVRDGHQFTVAEGRTGTDVTGTTIVLADGRRVTASTANGWFAAWWPGAVKATDANVATPSGMTTQHLDTGGPVLCGPGPCTRPAPEGPSTNVTSGGEHGGPSTSTVRAPGH
jgi:hypothetical protein